jgi:hypothetical protein
MSYKSTLRLRILVATAASSLLTAGALYEASPASASTLYGLCNVYYGNCLLADSPVQVAASDYTRFQAVNSSTWNGHAVYEWQQNHTDQCLQDDASNGNTIRMGTCTKGQESELWWHDGQWFVNVYLSEGGTNNCLTESPNNNGGPVNLLPCGEGNLGTTQAWTERS